MTSSGTSSFPKSVVSASINKSLELEKQECIPPPQEIFLFLKQLFTVDDGDKRGWDFQPKSLTTGWKFKKKKEEPYVENLFHKG